MTSMQSKNKTKARLKFIWAAGPGEIVYADKALSPAVVRGLGLMPSGYTADGQPTGYYKADASKPNEIEVVEATKWGPAAKDGNGMEADATEDERMEGLRNLVAKATGVENRVAGKYEYYGAKYANFVKLSSSEAILRQRHAAFLAAQGKKGTGQG